MFIKIKYIYNRLSIKCICEPSNCNGECLKLNDNIINYYYGMVVERNNQRNDHAKVGGAHNAVAPEPKGTQ